ncbi:hypothetical protein HY504_03590 [Candidatus Wolfebacteria bacterium]|nr:hypothetical protein [Candidatus Wolfebacteria bacterium]
MAQPVSLLEKELQLGREKIPIGWPWRLLTFTALLVGLAALLYAGMAFGYRAYLNSQTSKLDARLGEVSGSVADDRAAELRRLYSGLINAEALLTEHTISTKIFSLVEDTLHRDAYLTGMEIQTNERTVKLFGLVRSYGALGEELALLRARQEIQAAFLDESSVRDQGNVQFSIRLVMSPDSFKE